MKIVSVHKDMSWSAEDRTRHKALREKFQRERPNVEKLLADSAGPVPMADYLMTRVFLADLKEERERLGLTLDDLAKRSGIGKASLSRLESGRQLNPTLRTLQRYAAALGKHFLLGMEDLSGQRGQTDGQAAKGKTRKRR